MALLSVIRRWAFRDGMSIREITRRTGLSRNTIRKYLRSDALEPKFETVDRPSKLDPFADRLSGWLKTEASKSRKQRRTAKQIHTDLVLLGYDGSYSRVAAFIRAWKANRQVQEQTTGRGTFVPLVFTAGEAFQFDWSEDWAILGGERVKLQAAHTKLSHSRAFIVRACRSGSSGASCGSSRPWRWWVTCSARLCRCAVRCGCSLLPTSDQGIASTSGSRIVLNAGRRGAG